MTNLLASGTGAAVVLDEEELPPDPHAAADMATASNIAPVAPAR